MIGAALLTIAFYSKGVFMAFSLHSYQAPDFNALGLDGKPDVVLAPVVKDGVAPDNYHAMSIFPEYFKLDGKWILAKESRMDCVAVYDGSSIQVKEFRNLKKGEQVVLGRSEDGSEGIFLWADGFSQKQEKADVFAFRQQRSRETAFSQDYDELAELLKYERENGYVVWVIGPAFTFDAGARQAFSKMIAGGYVNAILAGNALATHDLEGAYLHTALGQDIYTRQNVPNGHYNHLDTINRVNSCGSIPAFLNQENIQDGIIYHCEKYHVPYVLAGSIRDDGPLAPVYGNVYEAQNAMRNHVRKATTVICMATMLHTIAVGNMTPSYRVTEDGTVRPLYFYCVDISEFTVNKLCDRGSLAAKGIVTNAQDFIEKLSRSLGL